MENEATLRELVAELQDTVNNRLKKRGAVSQPPITQQYPPCNEKTPITEIGVIVDDLYNVNDLATSRKINPPDSLQWIQIKDYDQFKTFLETRGIPAYVSFDSGLSDKKDAKDGLDCAKLLAKSCKAAKQKLPHYEVHAPVETKKQQIELALLD